MATTWISGIGFDDRWTPPLSDATADELDWADIFRRYHVDVRAFVRNRVPAAWVDDTVQDTFVRAYRSRHRLDASRPIWPWLMTIAKRACIETCRQHRAEVAFDGSVHSLAAPDDPHVELERHQRAAAIAGALDSLPSRHRRLLVRYELEGRPYAELAVEEDISGQALKSALCRARESFRVRYAALAEANGLVGLATIGSLLARLRGRWHRGHDAMTRMPPEVAGALFLGLTATAWMAAVPAAQKASSAPVMSHVAMIGDSIGAAMPEVPEAPVIPGVPPAVSGAPGLPSATEAHVDAPPPSNEPEPTTRLLPRAHGTADVGSTAGGSRAAITVELTTLLGERWNWTTIIVECSDGVSGGPCRTVHHVVGGQ